MAAGAAIGSGVGALGSLIGGQSTANALNAQSTIQQSNAQLAVQQGQFDATKQQLIAGKKIGAISAGYGASGVRSDSGSVQAILGSSAANSELDRLNILHGAQIKAINYENQASLDSIGAQSALTASYFGAVGDIASGASKMSANSAGGGNTDGHMTGTSAGSSYSDFGDIG